MRIAMIDHSYHEITGSAGFFLDLLSKIGPVRCFYDQSWCGGQNDWRTGFDETEYDLIVIWQVPEAFDVLSGNHDNMLFVPMYDALWNGSTFYWLRQFEKAKCLSFCRKLHREIEQRDGMSRYFQFFPDPAEFQVTAANKGVHALFWYRRSVIDANLIFDLCGTTAIEKLIVHNAPDLGQARLAISNWPINIARHEITDGFKDRSAYRRLVSESNLWFAPRPVEGIGMGYLEAMASGLCVVSPDFPTMNEYIASGENGILYSLDQRHALDLSRIHEIGARARESIERGFESWQRALPEMLEFTVTPTARLRKTNLLKRIARTLRGDKL